MAKHLPAEDPSEWLVRARFNLMTAREPHLVGGPLAELVFNAHLVAEKACPMVSRGPASPARETRRTPVVSAIGFS
jgi:hypothetical protein